MIKFEKVRWKNFLSTGNQFTEIDLNRNDTTLIIGENGAGKSTVLDALCFSLFGKPFRSISKSQLVNTVNAMETVVEIEFSIASRNYKIVRGIKPNIFEIWQNDKMLNQEANNRDYQKILEQQILKLNFRSFTQVVILGSSTFVPFMQLKAKFRREVVEDLLDIKIFSIMNMLLKQRLKDLVIELQEVEYNYKLCSEKIIMQENYIEDIKKNKDLIINEKNDNYHYNSLELDKKKNDKVKLEKINKNLFESVTDQISIESKDVKLKDLRSTLTEKQKEKDKMIKFFEEHDDCPVCEQDIPKDFKTKMIDIKKDESNEIVDGLTKMEKELSKTENRLNEIKKITDNIQTNSIEIASLNTSIQELEKWNIKIDNEITELEKSTLNNSDEEKLNTLKKEYDDIELQKKSLREEKNYSEASRAMLQDTGIKTKIIKQYLPIMNQLINKYLASMEFYVNFTLDENFVETIKSRFRDNFNYDSFSEGEKMRIDLALLFTWRAIAKMKNSTNTNLLILDEIFDSSLDSAGTDEFLKILNTLEGENVFVISHKQDVLVDKFKHTLKFEKNKNFSKMVAA
jgi:DNA repair exonuclease SbcCD ATPase subunit